MKKVVLTLVAFSVFDVRGIIRSKPINFEDFNLDRRVYDRDPDDLEVEEEEDDLDEFPTTEVLFSTANMQSPKNDAMDENLTPSQCEIVSIINGCNSVSSGLKTTTINLENFLYALNFIERHLLIWLWQFEVKLSQQDNVIELGCLLQRSAEKDIRINAKLSTDFPKDSWRLEKCKYYCCFENLRLENGKYYRGFGSCSQIKHVNEFFEWLKEQTQIKNLNSCTIYIGKYKFPVLYSGTIGKYKAFYLDAVLKLSKD